MEVNFIVLDVLVVFIDQFERNLNKEEHPHMPKIFQTIKQLLSSNSEHFLNCIYTTLAGLIFKLKKPLFAHKTTSYCQDLMYKVLQHCNHASSEIRSKASTLFYLLMKVCVVLSLWILVKLPRSWIRINQQNQAFCNCFIL